MATYATNRLAADRRFAGGRVQRMFFAVLDAMTAWNDARVTRNALSQLSDHELDDIGLHRGDIERIVG